MYHYHQLKKMANFFWPGTAVQRYRANFIPEEVPQNRVTEVQATKKTSKFILARYSSTRYRANFNLEYAILCIEYGSTEVQDINVQKTTELHRYRA